MYIPEYYAHKCIKKCTSINKHFERHHFMKNKSVRRYSLKSVLLKDNVLKMQILIISNKNITADAFNCLIV